MNKEKWFESQREIYGKGERRGNFFLVKFSDGCDLFYWSDIKNKSTMLDIESIEDINDLINLLCPERKYRVKRKGKGRK